MTELEIKTDKIFWASYWADFIPYIVNHILFEDIFSSFPEGRLKSIEIGGYPATNSIYLIKNKKYQATIIDYYIDREKIKQAELINQIPSGSINIIEEDFLNYQTQQTYDIVISNGFIEHFNDVQPIIKKHYDLLNVNGWFFISLPNFLGLNGLVQKLFDKKNFCTHNLEIMDINLLKSIFNNYKFKDISVNYYGKPCLWLEKTAPVNFFVRIFIRLLSKLLSFINYKNKFLSPYIVILANK